MKRMRDDSLNIQFTLLPEENAISVVWNKKIFPLRISIIGNYLAGMVLKFSMENDNFELDENISSFQIELLENEQKADAYITFKENVNINNITQVNFPMYCNSNSEYYYEM